MSLLRVSIPGQSPRHVDLGPSVGRVSHTRYGVKGGSTLAYGSFVVGTSERDRQNAANRAYKARLREMGA